MQDGKEQEASEDVAGEILIIRPTFNHEGVYAGIYHSLDGVLLPGCDTQLMEASNFPDQTDGFLDSMGGSHSPSYNILNSLCRMRFSSSIRHLVIRLCTLIMSGFLCGTALSVKLWSF